MAAPAPLLDRLRRRLAELPQSRAVYEVWAAIITELAAERRSFASPAELKQALRELLAELDEVDIGSFPRLCLTLTEEGVELARSHGWLRQQDGQLTLRTPTPLTQPTHPTPRLPDLTNDEMTGVPELVEDAVHRWLHNDHPAVYHRRAWRLPDGQLVAVVGEPTDNVGISVTNGAERIVEHARAAFGDDVIVIEHYPDGLDHQPSYAEIVCRSDRQGHLRAGWIHLDPTTLADRLAGYLPQTWTREEYRSDRIAGVPGPGLAALPGWIPPAQRTASARLAAEAQARGMRPASLALGDGLERAAR